MLIAPPLAFVMVIEFATGDCVVDPLDVVVEVLGEVVDEAVVEVDEDGVFDVVVEVLGEAVDEVAVEVDDGVIEVVVEVLGVEVDEVAVEVDEDGVFDVVVEVLGCGARVPVTVTVRALVAVTYPGADAVIIIACVPGMMMLFHLVCRSPKGSV